MLEISGDDGRASVLKEHDYIGLSEASSAACAKLNASPQNAKDVLQDADLHLELGLGLGLASGFAKKEGQREPREAQLSKPGQTQLDLMHASVLCGAGAASKKWMKRGFSETVVATPTLRNPEADAVLPKQGSFTPMWTPPNPAPVPSWHSGGQDSTSSRAPAKDIAHTSKDNVQESVIDDAPPAKGRVVGWPPVRSYRRQTLAKPAEMFVKVNMDGITVGRKIDLNAYSSYESLLRALEEMFQPSNSVTQGAPGREHDLKHFLLASDSDFVLTYEDRDGDWMLVGDVPWSMFVSTVKRLRITRGSEATGSGARALDKSGLHG